MGSVDAAAADAIDDGSDVALMDPATGQPLATMTVTEKYRIDKAHECRAVFKTTDIAHPGVRMVMEQGDVNLGGHIRVLSTSYFGEEFGRLFLTPAQTRAMFEERGWSKVADGTWLDSVCRPDKVCR